MHLTGEDGPRGSRDVATICRLSADGIRWRVRVETWQAENGVAGRLVFEPDGPGAGAATRFSGPLLRARRPEEMVAAAHELPESRLRELLHSLG